MRMSGVEGPWEWAHGNKEVAEGKVEGVEEESCRGKTENSQQLFITCLSTCNEASLRKVPTDHGHITLTVISSFRNIILRFLNFRIKY